MAYDLAEVCEIQEKLVAEIQTGRSLRQVCGDDGMPDIRTVTRWLVADWLGVDDGDSRLDWQYRQRSAGVKVYGVEIEVI